MPINPSTTEGMPARTSTSGLRISFTLLWCDLSDINGGADAERQGDDHRKDGDDQRSADEREDAKQIFNWIPACGEKGLEGSSRSARAGLPASEK